MSTTPRTDAAHDATLTPEYEYEGAEHVAWEWARELEKQYAELWRRSERLGVIAEDQCKVIAGLREELLGERELNADLSTLQQECRLIMTEKVNRVKELEKELRGLQKPEMSKTLFKWNDRGGLDVADASDKHSFALPLA